MRIVIGAPDGIAPAVEPLTLPDGWATVARDVKLWEGHLMGYRAPLQIAPLTKTGIKRGLYRFGQGRSSDDLLWLHWNAPVHVVRSPVSTMTLERTYFTGDGVPKVTDATMVAAGGGTDYPMVAKPIGVPTPTQEPVASVVGAGSDSVSDRRFVYTFVNEWGEEGPPSDPSNKVSVSRDQTVQLDNLAVPSGAWGYQTKRIYMSQGTGSNAYFYFIAEIAVGLTTATVTPEIVDGTGLVNTGEQLMTVGWLPPPEDMHSICVLPGGVLAGLSDKTVVFSEPGYPYAWPPVYSIPIDHTPIACAVLDLSIVVGTSGYPYIIQGNIPGQQTVRKLESEPACVSATSMIAGGGGVAYASPEGFHLITASGSVNTTAAFFTKDQWQALEPSKMIATWWNRRFVIFFGDRKGSMILEDGRAPVMCSVWADSAYVDPEFGCLYVAQGNAVYRFDAGEALPWLWRSKPYLSSKPANFSVCHLRTRGFQGVLRVVCDDKVRGVLGLPFDIPRRLPAGFMGDRHQFELEGTGVVALQEYAQSMRELGAA